MQRQVFRRIRCNVECSKDIVAMSSVQKNSLQCRNFRRTRYNVESLEEFVATSNVQKKKKPALLSASLTSSSRVTDIIIP